MWQESSKSQGASGERKRHCACQNFDNTVKLALKLIGNPIVEGMETLIGISEEE
jgi:hypothetical protein